jgi:hypothetical protein
MYVILSGGGRVDLYICHAPSRGKCLLSFGQKKVNIKSHCFTTEPILRLLHLRLQILQIFCLHMSHKNVCMYKHIGRLKSWLPLPAARTPNPATRAHAIAIRTPFILKVCCNADKIHRILCPEVKKKGQNVFIRLCFWELYDLNEFFGSTVRDRTNRDQTTRDRTPRIELPGIEQTGVELTGLNFCRLG